jgi:hypothetical protein
MAMSSTEWLRFYWEMSNLVWDSTQMIDCDTIHNYDSIRKEYVKYTWFVSNALGAAEIVWHLQKGDPDWGNTLKQVLKNYEGFYNSKNFLLNDYSQDMQDLITKARDGDTNNRCHLK